MILVWNRQGFHEVCCASLSKFSRWNPQRAHYKQIDVHSEPFTTLIEVKIDMGLRGRTQCDTRIQYTRLLSLPFAKLSIGQLVSVFLCQISLLSERVHLQLFICLVELDSLAARNWLDGTEWHQSSTCLHWTGSNMAEGVSQNWTHTARTRYFLWRPSFLGMVSCVTFEGPVIIML